MISLASRAAVAAAVLALAAAACGGPGNFTAHGSEQVCADAPDITDGTQVTVTDSANHVIGTGTLATDGSAAATKLVQQYDSLQASLGTFGNSSGIYIYKFTVSDLPAGQQRYGISIGQNRGTICSQRSR